MPLLATLLAQGHVPADLTALLTHHYRLPITVAVVGEVLWLPTYVLLIRAGHRQRTYGMPMLALCLAFALNFLFSFCWSTEPLLCPHSPYGSAGDLAIVGIWWLCLGFSAVILRQYVRTGRTPPLEYPALARAFVPTLLVTLALAFAVQYTFLLFNADFNANQLYQLFALAISALFVLSFLGRDGVGHSLPAAWTRFFADGFIVLGVSWITWLVPPGDPVNLYPGHEQDPAGFVYVTSAAIVGLNALYVILVTRGRRPRPGAA